MSKIKVLEVESSRGWGGQEKRTVRLVNELNPNKFESHFVVQQDSELFRRRKEIKAKFHTLKMRKSYDIFAAFKLAKIISDNKIDIVSTHSGGDGWIGLLAAKIAGVKVVRTRHLQTPITKALSYNWSDVVVCVSDAVSKGLSKKGVLNSKLRVIYTGIDTELYAPDNKDYLRKELNIADSIPLIGIVAVLRKAKRHLFLLEALTSLDSDFRVVIIGDGPQLESISSYIQNNNLDRKAVMLGHREDVNKMLPSLDVFVLPSEMEALGTSLLEASSSGVPVVATNIGGMAECVHDASNGFLFELNDVEGLSRILKKLILDKQLRHELGANGRELIKSEFSVSRMVSQTEELYEALLS